jgi:hypothetical protein
MRKDFFSTTVLFVVATVASIHHAAVGFAQNASPGEGLIPDTATAAIFVRPKAIFSDPAMEFVPYEIITAMGKEEFGIDPCDCELAMMLVDSFDDLRDPPGFALMLKFSSEQTLNDRVTEEAEMDELKGKPLMRFGSRETDPVIYRPNAKTIVIGMEPFIEKMLAAKGAKSSLIDLVRNSNVESEHFTALLSVDPIRDFVEENLPPKNQLPPPFQGFRDLPELVDSIAIRLNFNDNPTNSIEITGVDADAATEIDETIRNGISMGRDLLMGSLAEQMGENDALYSAVEAYNDRVGAILEQKLRPTVEGNKLTFEAKNSAQLTNAATVGTLIGMLLPAVQQVREAARRTAGLNQLRQIALASLNYESAHMHFPGNIEDEDGNVLLSWRVAILPYIEENALYDQFHLDEPWDSEHNIKLLDQMPAIYGSRKFKSKTKTLFLGFEGEGTMFEPAKELGFGQIVDGSSNTILCVEADPDAAIEWSKPADLPFDREEAITQVGHYRRGIFNAVFCDGSCHSISSDVDMEVLMNLIQRNDGNIVDRNW